VEGPTDQRFFTRLVDRAKCWVFFADDKENVLDVVPLLRDRSRKGVLGVVDLDFDGLVGGASYGKDILATDTHDIETMMLNSPALDGLLRDLSDEESVKAFCNSRGKCLPDILLEVARPIGCLRFYSQKADRALCFKNIDFTFFIDSASLLIDVDLLVSEVNCRTYRHFDGQELKDGIESVEKSEYNPWHICQGHDIVAVLYIGLTSIFGNRNAKILAHDVELEKRLIDQYDWPMFGSSDLCDFMRQWEVANKPYALLRTS
jgi:hypothetical protein